MVDGRTRHRVGGVAIRLEKGFDAVEHRLLCGVVGSAEVGCALEHHVLEIVGQTCCLRGVVFAAYAHGDIGLDARRTRVLAHEYLEPVGKGVNLGVQWIAGH